MLLFQKIIRTTSMQYAKIKKLKFCKKNYYFKIVIHSTECMVVCTNLLWFTSSYVYDIFTNFHAMITKDLWCKTSYTTLHLYTYVWRGTHCKAKYNPNSSMYTRQCSKT